MGFIHSRNVFQKEVITFSRLWKERTKKEARLIIREEKIGATECQALMKIPQAMRNMKESILEEPLIHLSIWIRNDDVMNEEDDEAERMSLPMKQIKISIQLSFHNIVLLYI